MISRAVAETALGGFRRKRVLVVGDLMLDRYIWGEVTRISPEAPVPVVRMVRRSETAGGAANVALNLAGLGLDVAVAGFVGEDNEGLSLRGHLREGGVDVATLVELPGHPTTAKTRIMGGKQQMLRLDVEVPGSGVPEAAVRTLEGAVLDRLARGIDVLLLSDYDKGVLAPCLCRRVIRAAGDAGIPVVVDPKGRDYGKYAGATVLTPNQLELAVATATEHRHLGEMLEAGKRLQERLELAFLVVTRGEDGITLIRNDEARHFPAVAQQVFDVSGAGDTVVATLAAGLAAGIDIESTLRLANLAAGYVVGRVGTYPISREDLRSLLGAYVVAPTPAVPA